MYYLKYMPYKSIRAASRNKRELDAAAEAGYKTAVFSNDRQEEALAYFGGEIINDGTLPMLGSKVKRIITIVRNRLTVYKNTLALPNGVWSCHDLHSLKIAYFATRFRLKKPIFIYDSHEFEMGRNTRRNAFQRFLTKHEERFLMNRCAFSIMVNDSIADEVQRIHKLKKRPIVVRSTPDYWTIDEDVCKEQHRLFM